jgi:hypothetical protein
MTERLVLLGACNLARGLHTVMTLAERREGRPLQVFAAAGHGRSYGARSRVLGRSLPGILECALWDELLRQPKLPTRAVVADVGNDIVYGVTNDRILEWVEVRGRRLQRLPANGAQALRHRRGRHRTRCHPHGAKPSVLMSTFLPDRAIDWMMSTITRNLLQRQRGAQPSPAA